MKFNLDAISVNNMKQKLESGGIQLSFNDVI